MGELIRREVAAAPLEFSGERLTGATSGQIEIEHYHRYLLAREFCRGRDVLDVAAGEGYGTALLAQIARSAVGVEIDAETVAAARAAFQRPNLRYEQGDARLLPVPDASIDVAVSFETLEHLAEQDLFLSELRRVLRPGGLLIMSTPDRDAYSPAGTPPNTFHVLELTRPEFEALVQRHFAHAAFAAQRALIGSVILGAGQGTALRSYEKRSDAVIEGSDNLSRAPYLVAFASDAALPPLPNSVYVYRGDVDTDTLARFAAEAGRRCARRAEEGAQREANASRVIAELEGRAAAAAHHAEASERRVEAAERSAQAAQRRADDAAAEVEFVKRQAADAEWRLSRIEGSTTWRATRPLRRSGQRFPFLARNLRRGMKLAWWTVTLQLPRRYRDYRRLRRQSQPTEDGAVPDVDLRDELGLPPSINPVPPAGDIVVPSRSKPVVSIIIPSFGQVDFTLRCLASLAASPSSVPIEVIVVDDASSDPRIAELRSVRGIRLILRDNNLGFLRSCNDAARSARGTFLMLLNNDTEVMPGAIDALAALLTARPDIGMAGARLLYPNGSQQEAGGIIWRDGSAWNYGNRDDPRKPEYSYVRETDYISGAAIMLPRAIWDRLGGFDEHFTPAYCEDSDLAFRVRDAGLKVVYHPEACIIHYEGISHGTDTASGVKAHQIVNTTKLFERWKTTLRRSHLPSGQRVMRARDRSVDRTVTLVIDHLVPEPDRDAGSRTMIAFMEALLAAGRVVKFFPLNGVPTPGYTAALQRRGIEVQYSPWCGSFAAWIAANGAEIDEVLVSRPTIAAEALPLLADHCRAPIVFYGHDLHHARMRSEPGAKDDPEKCAAADAAETIERQVWREVDVVLYPSDDEVAAVRALEPGVTARAIAAYALPAAPSARTPTPASAGLVFVAGFAHPPNEDAALWLVHEILPRLRAVRPDLPLALVGSHPTQAVLDLAGDGVEVTGFVPDEELARRYAAARVAVCPLRFGAGVKLKVVEAMHHGVPLVTTQAGAQGLTGLDAIVDVHDDPDAFAASVLRLLDDDVLWASRAKAQSAFVAARFSSDAIQAALTEAFAVARRPAEAETASPEIRPAAA